MCYINGDEIWLLHLLSIAFRGRSQTLWLHLATNSRARQTRRPFAVQQVAVGEGITTFVATPVLGVEKVCANAYDAAQTLEDLLEEGVPQPHEALAAGRGRRRLFEARINSLVNSCLNMKSVELVRHVWAVKNFVAAASTGGKQLDVLRGEILLNQVGLRSRI